MDISSCTYRTKVRSSLGDRRRLLPEWYDGCMVLLFVQMNVAPSGVWKLLPRMNLSRLRPKLALLPVRAVLGGRRRLTSRYRSLYRLSVGFVLLVSPVFILV